MGDAIPLTQNMHSTQNYTLVKLEFILSQIAHLVLSEAIANNGLGTQHTWLSLSSL